jgi:hypothetical protein
MSKLTPQEYDIRASDPSSYHAYASDTQHLASNSTANPQSISTATPNYLPHFDVQACNSNSNPSSTNVLPVSVPNSHSLVPNYSVPQHTYTHSSNTYPHSPNHLVLSQHPSSSENHAMQYSYTNVGYVRFLLSSSPPSHTLRTLLLPPLTSLFRCPTRQSKVNTIWERSCPLFLQIWYIEIFSFYSFLSFLSVLLSFLRQDPKAPTLKLWNLGNSCWIATCLQLLYCAHARSDCKLFTFDQRNLQNNFIKVRKREEKGV